MTRVSYSQHFEASLLLMWTYEEQDSTTSCGIFLTWSLWPQRTISLLGLTMKIWVMTSTKVIYHTDLKAFLVVKTGLLESGFYRV